MNGRIYDPEIGRFLRADPIVQYPESTQGYDRYQYVANNPLSATDPSGYFSEEFNQAMSAVVSITVGLVTGGLIAGPAGTMTLLGSSWGAHAAAGAIGGAMAGFVVEPGGGMASTYGAMAGLLAGSVGGGYHNGAYGTVVKSLLHGMTQGGLAAAHGGRFGDGALGAFASSALGDWAQGQEFNPVIEAIVMAVIGGAASELGGGKFANGAISAAFVNMYNDQLSKPPRKGLPSEKVLHGARDLAGTAVFRNTLGQAECVELVKQNSPGSPKSTDWIEGRKVLPGVDIEIGTAIATFESGRYLSKPTGNHAGYYLGQDSKGIFILEQYRGLDQVKISHLPWNVPSGTSPSKNGSAYSTIRW